VHTTDRPVIISYLTVAHTNFLHYGIINDSNQL